MIQKDISKKIKEFVKRVLGTPVFQRIIKNSSYLLSATGITLVLGIVQNIFVYRMITVGEAGLLASIATFTNAANKLASFRIQEMVVRYMRLYIEQGKTQKAAAVYKLAGIFEVAGSIIAFALIWVLSPWGAEFFGDDASTRPLWLFYGIVVLINFIFNSSTGLLQVFTRFRVIATANVVQKIATLLLSIYLYFNNGSLFDILLLIMGGKLVHAIGVSSAAVWTAHQKWGAGWWRNSPLKLLKEDRRSIFTFAFSTNISNTISLVTKDSENLWVAAFLGTEAVGYYNFAAGLVSKLKLPISPLAQTTYPELAREVAKKKWASVKDTLKRSSVLAAAYTLPILLFLVFLGKPAIALLYGEKWLPAYALLMILMVGVTFDNIFFWNRVALLAFNRPVYPTIINFVGMVIKVGLIFVLVEKYQAYAFAGLLSFYYVLVVGLAVLRVSKDIKIKLATEQNA